MTEYIFWTAEGAVNDVKRQAMLELQKAVAAAEAKASEALSSDRLDIDRTLDEVRERTKTEVAELLNRQVDCNEVSLKHPAKCK